MPRRCDHKARQPRRGPKTANRSLSDGLFCPGVKEMTRCFTQIESPLGPLLLAADEAGLREIRFVNGRHPAQPDASWKEDRAPLSETSRQLQVYFAGELESFDLQLAPEGTPFQL